MKKTNRFNLSRQLSLLIVLVSFAACASISLFDHYAYTQTTSLKVDALNCLELAMQDYTTNEKTVEALQSNLQKAYEYEKHRPQNKITLQLWDKLLDSNGHLLGGCLKRWQTEKKLSAVFVQEEKKIVGEAFDQIAELESKKIKASDIKSN
ncbi:MAG: hypothetical protein WCL51_13620 [Bacteroidota bacterium]